MDIKLILLLSIGMVIGVSQNALAQSSVLTISERSNPIYLVAGQSNAHRMTHYRLPVRGQAARLEHEVDFYFMSCVNPEAQPYRVKILSTAKNSFSYTFFSDLVREANGPVTVIQYAVCGRALFGMGKESWNAGTDPRSGDVFDGGYFKKFLNFIDFALNDVSAKPDIKGMFWLLGEGDSARGYKDRKSGFTTNFDNFLKRIEIELGDFPIVVGGIREIDSDDVIINDVYREFDQNNSISFVESSTEYFYDDEKGPNVHYSWDGMQEMSTALIKAMMNAQSESSN